MRTCSEDCEGDPDVILIGTGSEVQYAVEAQRLLADEGISARVVSMPCREWFDEQDQAYRDSVIPPDSQGPGERRGRRGAGWRDIVGDAGRIISIDHYGASASGAKLFEEFGFSAATVVEAAKESLAAVESTRCADPSGGRRTQGARRTWKPTRGSRSAEPSWHQFLTKEELIMSERLKALADAGVSIWLDDLSRDRITSGNLAELVSSSSVSGVTTNPTIFAAALSKGHALRRPDQGAGGAGRRAARHDQGADHRRRPQRLRRLRRDLRGHQRGRRPGLDRGRPGPGPRDRGDHRPGSRPVEDRRPAERADQDPGHQGRPAVDHRGDRGGGQRQRHADLLPGALPRA